MKKQTMLREMDDFRFTLSLARGRFLDPPKSHPIHAERLELIERMVKR